MSLTMPFHVIDLSLTFLAAPGSLAAPGRKMQFLHKNYIMKSLLFGGSDVSGISGTGLPPWRVPGYVQIFIDFPTNRRIVNDIGRCRSMSLAM